MVFLGILAAAVIGWFIWRAEPVQAFLRQGRSVVGRGQWRPTAAVVVVIAVVGAAALALRGAWPVSLGLLAIALWSGLFIRRGGERASSRNVMSRAEASFLLGLGADPSPAEVREAYRRLMQRAHPDTGGTQGLASQLNAARDVLLSRPR